MFFVAHFLTKAAQMFGDNLGFFEKHPRSVKTTVANIWSSFGKNLATFYSIIWLHCLGVIFKVTKSLIS